MGRSAQLVHVVADVEGFLGGGVERLGSCGGEEVFGADGFEVGDLRHLSMLTDRSCSDERIERWAWAKYG